MTDLERLFSLIVTNLAATDRARLNQAIPVTELMRAVVPYRTSRRALGVVTSDEYEHLLVRFVAGEGGFARTVPEESRARFAAEARAVNPDPGVLTAEGDAAVWFTAEKVAHALGGGIELERGYAPPSPPAPSPPLAAAPEMPEEPEFEIDIEPTPRLASEQCEFCGGSLPPNRVAHFCPWCGQHLDALRCPRCQAEVELGWRNCIACGTSLN